MRYYESPATPSPLDRAQALTDHLGVLSGRVREAVAEAVGETLARLARDAADRLLGPPPEHHVPVHRYGSPSQYEGDPWADPEPETSSHHFDGEPTPMAANEQMALGKALAAGLATAGWWLRRGQPWAAIGAGTAVAAVVAAGARLGRTGQSVTGAVADLMAVAVPLARRASGRLGS
jgi:hypothetical protein